MKISVLHFISVIVFMSCNRAEKSDNFQNESITKEGNDTSNSEVLIAENANDRPISDKNVNENGETYLQVEMNDLVLSRKNDNSEFDQEIVTQSNDDFFVPGKERKIISKPVTVNPTKENGIVTVLVSINSEGVVVESKIIVGQKTKTQNQTHFEQAKKLAAQYVFEPLENGPDVTRQYIDFFFE